MPLNGLRIYLEFEVVAACQISLVGAYIGDVGGGVRFRREWRVK